jgi:hypothetical protein
MGLEAVEMVMGWEQSLGVELTDGDVESLRTPHQSMHLIALKLSAQDEPPQACLTLRAFYRLRYAITTATGLSRKQVRPSAKLRDLVRTERRRTWDTIRTVSGISSLPSSLAGLGWCSPRTVGDLTRWTVAYAAKDLKYPGERWTYAEIRSVVRAVITDVTGVEDFGDDDDFVRDLGVG